MLKQHVEHRGDVGTQYIDSSNTPGHYNKPLSLLLKSSIILALAAVLVGAKGGGEIWTAEVQSILPFFWLRVKKKFSLWVAGSSSRRSQLNERARMF